MERRMYPRRLVSLPVDLETIEPKMNIRLSGSGEISDISLGGVGLSLDACLAPGTSVKLRTNLGPKKAPLETEAQVRWTNFMPRRNKFHHGLQFLNPDHDILRNALRDINITNIESFFDAPLPNHIKENYLDDWITKKFIEREIKGIVDFQRPFLKTEKIIIFDDGDNLSNTQGKSLGTGVLTTDDTKGHYNDTMFLALCGLVMASTASIHLATLFPGKAPQVVEASGVRPVISFENKQHIWKPAQEGTRFFVETRILKKKLNLAIVETVITFSNILYGTVDELKLIITPGDSIYRAKTFPAWNWDNGDRRTVDES